MREVLRPHLRPTPGDPKELVLGPDARADVYLDDQSLMVSHINGSAVLDLLVDAARAGSWAIMPIGVPTAVTSPDLIAHLPEGLGDGAVVVSSGAELLRLIES